MRARVAQDWTKQRRRRVSAASCLGMWWLLIYLNGLWCQPLWRQLLQRLSFQSPCTSRYLPTVSQPCPPQWREMDRDCLPQVLAPFLPDFTSGQCSSPEALLALWDLRPVVESYGRTVAILLKDWPELDTWALEQAQKNARIFLFMLCTLEWPPSLSATIDWTLCNKTFNLLTHYHGLCEDLTPPSTV